MENISQEEKEILSKNGYDFIEIIGQGNFGLVYKVTSRSDNNNYAIKKLKSNMRIDQKELEAFKQEIEILQHLDCPFIVKYIETIKDPLLLVTEFVEGENLQKIIEKKTKEEEVQGFEQKEIIKWIAQLAIGINYLHKHHVMHRDLSSKNIIITKEGNIKICDFGVSSKFDNTMDIKTTLAGTISYCAPEFFKKKTSDTKIVRKGGVRIKKKVSEQSKGFGYNKKIDTWSLGVIIYEIYTLGLPFEDVDNIIQNSYLHLDEQDNKDIKYITEKLLVKNPDERLSAEDLISKNKIK